MITFLTVIPGYPVSSSNSNKAGKAKSGKTVFYKTAEYNAWKNEASLAIRGTLLRGNQQILWEQKLHPKKNPTYTATNPLFPKGTWVTVYIWVVAPTHKTILVNGKPRKHLWHFDVESVFKGLNDTAQSEGILGDDYYIRHEEVDRIFTVEGSDPYVIYLVQEWMEGDQQSPPTSVYSEKTLSCPRVFSQHLWHELREMEEVMPKLTLIAKARCCACYILIGSGHYEDEIWWAYMPARFKNRVVLFCGDCATNVHQLDDCKGTCGVPHTEDRFAHRLVSSRDIKSISWSEINKLRRIVQERIGHDNTGTDSHCTTTNQGGDRKGSRNDLSESQSGLTHQRISAKREPSFGVGRKTTPGLGLGRYPAMGESASGPEEPNQDSVVDRSIIGFLEGVDGLGSTGVFQHDRLPTKRQARWSIPYSVVQSSDDLGEGDAETGGNRN